MTIHKPDSATKTVHIGLTKAVATPSENKVVSSTYCKTMPWVTQFATSKAGVVIGGIIAIIFVSLLNIKVVYAGDRTGPTSTHLEGAKVSDFYTGLPAVVDQSHFFDFDFAKKAFENYETFQDLDNGFDAEYAAWDKKFNNKPRAEALAALEKHPNKIKIMQAHDFQWAYNAWSEIVFRKYSTTKTDAFPGVRQLVNWSGWNNWDDYFCTGIKKRNIFNDSCIVPDWRTTDQKIFALNQRNSINITREKEIDLLESLLKDKTLGNKNRKVIQGSLDRLITAK